LSSIEKLLRIMKHLRDPSTGCPWDLQQSFATIAPYTVEEAYEVLDAILRDDMPDLQSELGDLLFQVVFHAQLAAEQGFFQFDDVVIGIADKLERRHPHVFGDNKIDNTETQTQAWEKLKAIERLQKHNQINLASDISQANINHSALDGVAVALPALIRAVKLQKRAASVGFDWPSIEPVFDKVLEELDEVRQEVNENQNMERIEDEIGDLFFAVTNLARHANVDPETAIRKANNKFTRRFQAVEMLIDEQSACIENLSSQELERLYQKVKKMETKTS